MGNATKTPAFLFVNKTSLSDSLTRSKSDEQFDILSHVQQRRRQGTAKKPQSEPWASQTSFIDFDNEDSSGQGGKAGADGAQRLPFRLEHTRSQWPPTRLSGVYPRNNGCDPFYCTVAGNEPCVYNILFYSFSYFATSTFLAEAFAPSLLCEHRAEMRHNETIVQRLKHCVENDMLMYATLAYGSSCLAWTLGKTEGGKAPEYFIARTLPAVRARLLLSDQTTDTWLLLSIYCLAIVEMWKGTPQMWTKYPSKHADALMTADGCRKACDIHIRALVSLVNSVGGLFSINPYILESIILLDKYLAISEMRRPTLPLTWDPGHSILPGQEFFETLGPRLDRLGSGFAQMELCHQLANIIQDIADYARAAHRIWSGPNVTSKDESWLFLRLQALIYRLLLLDELQGLENCVRLATLLFLQNGMHYEGAKIGSAVILPHFKTALVEANVMHVSCGSGLVLWLLCTGAIMTENVNEYEWFIDNIASLSNSLQLDRTENTLQEVLEVYLFLAEEQDCRLNGVIDSVRAKREVA